MQCKLSGCKIAQNGMIADKNLEETLSILHKHNYFSLLGNLKISKCWELSHSSVSKRKACNQCCLFIDD